MDRPERLKFKKLSESPCPGPRVHVIRHPLGPSTTPGKGFARQKSPEVKMSVKDKIVQKSTKEILEEETDQKELAEEFKRVKEILDGRKHGLYVAQVEKHYSKKWGEVLKEGWWKEMKEFGVLVIELLDSGNLAKWVSGH